MRIKIDSINNYVDDNNIGAQFTMKKMSITIVVVNRSTCYRMLP